MQTSLTFNIMNFQLTNHINHMKSLILCQSVQRLCVIGDSMHPNGPDSEAHIAPEDDKNHEHYEQHEKVMDEETEAGTDEPEVPPKNGKAKGNTSV